MKLTLIKGHPETRVRVLEYWDSYWLARYSRRLWPNDNPLFQEFARYTRKEMPPLQVERMP